MALNHKTKVQYVNGSSTHQVTLYKQFKLIILKSSYVRFLSFVTILNAENNKLRIVPYECRTSRSPQTPKPHYQIPTPPVLIHRYDITVSFLKIN